MGHERVRKVGESERVEGQPTSGMIREEAIATGGLWAGLVRTDPGMTSGWHHHGDHETAIYVLSGVLRMESGPGGSDVVVAEPGDFVLVPRLTVHREGNPSDEEGRLIVARSGTGEVVVNTEGPDRT
jgi:uncharacterized RmlC-like cupin family protein